MTVHRGAGVLGGPAEVTRALVLTLVRMLVPMLARMPVRMLVLTLVRTLVPTPARTIVWPFVCGAPSPG